jgi:hypothetical protein
MRLSPLARFVPAAALTLACLSVSPARAQDPQPPAVDAPDAERAAALMVRMENLYPRAASRPAPLDRSLANDAEAMAKERKRFTQEQESWQAALDRLPELSLDYREAAGDTAAPVAWYFAGFARVVRSDSAGRSHGREMLSAGADDLKAYLDRAARDAVHRADAQHHLAYAMIRLAGGEEAGIVAAGEHADAAVRASLASGRSDPAGRLAFLMLKSLIGVGRESEAAALAAGWEAESADFGPSTANVRFLVRRARVRPGAKMPALPALDSYLGTPMPWEELAGKPYVLHFFSTLVSTTPREVETILVPLRDKWKDRGLQLVGCSTDREMDDEEIARTKALWNEWGKKETLHDGRLISVRTWAEQRGMEWPWYWDGKFTQNALAQHLGVEANAPFAILVDADGVIRWRGQPFQGLPEAVEQLLTQ